MSCCEHLLSYSTCAATFWEPNFETVVTPLPQCVTDDRPAKYPPVVYGDYILAKYKQAGAYTRPLFSSI
jgi:hypothetical protein